MTQFTSETARAAAEKSVAARRAKAEQRKAAQEALEEKSNRAEQLRALSEYYRTRGATASDEELMGVLVHIALHGEADADRVRAAQAVLRERRERGTDNTGLIVERKRLIREHGLDGDWDQPPQSAPGEPPVVAERQVELGDAEADEADGTPAVLGEAMEVVSQAERAAYRPR